MVAHNLVWVTISNISPHFYFDMPACIEATIINEMK